MSLGQNIANKRKERKLSQEYIAEQLGVSRQAVSKWETGQSEPTAKNLVELANLFHVTVSELIEPEKLPQNDKIAKDKQRQRAFELFAVMAYAGIAIMSTIETNDPGFALYTSFLMMIPAVMMAVNVLRLPADTRLSAAVKDLLYCMVIYCVITFLEPIIRNVLTSVVVCVCCALYIKYVRFREE